MSKKKQHRHHNKKHTHTKQKSVSRGVFRAQADIEVGRLPRRKDAVRYIVYLRDTLGYFIKQNKEYREELEKRGWEPPWKNWKGSPGGYSWRIWQRDDPPPTHVPEPGQALWVEDA